MVMRILLADDHVQHLADGPPSCLVRVVCRGGILVLLLLCLSMPWNHRR